MANLRRWLKAEPDVSNAEWLHELEALGATSEEAKRMLDAAHGQMELEV